VIQTRTKDRLSAFISSTVLDLPEHRAAAVNACLRVGVEPLVMEEQGAADSSPLARGNALLDQADIYIGILGFRYGFVPPGQQKSLTEIEFEHAREKGIPRLVFLMSEDHPVRATDVETGPGAEKLRLFKAGARREFLVSEFRSAEELKAAVITGLVEVLHDRSRYPKSTTALLLLPFSNSYEHLRFFLARELERQEVQVLRFDEVSAHGAMWANAIAEAISRADLVVADVTNASPNVMYELGYVHALKKPTIILSDSEALRSLPADLFGFQVLTYDRDNLEPLRRPLERILHEYVKEARR
jgi:hypothetical protein